MKGISLNSRKKRQYLFPTHEEKLIEIILGKFF
jgi:hypothetical protein